MRNFYILLFIIAPFNLLSQTLSELQQKCKKENTARNWNRLAEYYYEHDTDFEAFEDAVNKAYSRAIDENNDAEIGISLMFLGEIILETEGFEANIAKNEEALTYLNKTARKDLQAQANDNIGYAYNAIGNHDEAIKYHLFAKKILKEYNANDHRILRIDYNRSIAYIYKGEHDSVRKILYNIIPEAIKYKDTFVLGAAYNTLGVLHKRNHQFKEAIEYYERTLELYNDKEEIADKCNTILNIGTLYNDWKKYSQSLDFARRGAELAAEYPSKIDFLDRVYSDLGSALLNNGKYQEALDTLYIAQSYAKGNKYQAYINNIAIANAYLELNNPDSCEIYLHNAEQLLKENAGFPGYRFYKIKGGVLFKQKLFNEAIHYYQKYVNEFNTGNIQGSDDYEVYNQLSKCYQNGHKDYKQALYYKIIAYNMRDSIYKQEHTESVNEFYAKFQTLEKELEISRLNQDRQRILYNRTLIVGTLIFIAIILVIALLYSRIKQHKKEKETLQLANKIKQKELDYKILLTETQNRLVKSYLEGRESERKSLAKELHDSVANEIVSIMMHTQNSSRQERIKPMLEKIYNRIRQISHQLMPPEFNYISLTDMIEDYITILKQTIPINFKINISDEDKAQIDELHNELAKEIYYILQESIGNIYKHSNAANVTINIFFSPEGKLTLSIIDDGKGFDTTGSYTGIGLRTMNDRAIQIGAELKITSSPGTGTAIEIILTNPKLYHPAK